VSPGRLMQRCEASRPCLSAVGRGPDRSIPIRTQVAVADGHQPRTPTATDDIIYSSPPPNTASSCGTRDHTNPSGEVHTAASSSSPASSWPTATKPGPPATTALIIWSPEPPKAASSLGTRSHTRPKPGPAAVVEPTLVVVAPTVVVGATPVVVDVATVVTPMAPPSVQPATSTAPANHHDKHLVSRPGWVLFEPVAERCWAARPEPRPGGRPQARRGLRCSKVLLESGGGSEDGGDESPRRVGQVPLTRRGDRSDSRPLETVADDRCGQPIPSQS
jgi:hypothetical protein